MKLYKIWSVHEYYLSSISRRVFRVFDVFVLSLIFLGILLAGFRCRQMFGAIFYRQPNTTLIIKLRSYFAAFRDVRLLTKTLSTCKFKGGQRRVILRIGVKKARFIEPGLWLGASVWSSTSIAAFHLWFHIQIENGDFSETWEPLIVENANPSW